MKSSLLGNGYRRFIWTKRRSKPSAAAAAALGIVSLRAPLLAIAVTRASAALSDNSIVTQDDVALAARLVLVPRAWIVPQAEQPRGRPTGVQRGELKSGAKLNIIETLRAAAPWQPPSRAELANAETNSPRPRSHS